MYLVAIRCCVCLHMSRHERSANTSGIEWKHLYGEILFICCNNFNFLTISLSGIDCHWIFEYDPKSTPIYTQKKTKSGRNRERSVPTLGSLLSLFYLMLEVEKKDIIYTNLHSVHISKTENRDTYHFTQFYETILNIKTSKVTITLAKPKYMMSYKLQVKKLYPLSSRSWRQFSKSIRRNSSCLNLTIYNNKSFGWTFYARKIGFCIIGLYQINLLYYLNC